MSQGISVTPKEGGPVGVTPVVTPDSLNWPAASASGESLDRQEHPVRRRLFAQVAAVAVVGSTLAFGQVPATAAPAPTQGSAKAEATASVVHAAPKAFGPMDVAKYVKGLYDDYQTCRANEAIGQPCKASDSDNIRESLRLLQGLNDRVAALQKTLDNRLDDLDVRISQAELTTYQRDFTRIGKSAPRAVLAFSALVDCQAAKLAGEESCRLFDESGAGASAQVDDGIRYNRSAFLEYTDKESLPQSIPNTVAWYAGTGGALAANSFAYALWRFAKLKVDIEAGASQPIFRRSPYATIVTPSMSNEVNTYLSYYGDLLATHAEVLYLRAVVQRDAAAAAGDMEAATRFEDTANRIRGQIRADIEATDANSVRGVDLAYRLTPLSKGDIIMASSDGTGAMVIMTTRSLEGDRALRDTDVAALGQGLSLYGSYNLLKRNEPQAFPQGTDWYVVWTRAIRLLCDSDAMYLESGRSEVTWLPSVVRPKDRYTPETVNTRVKLLEDPPEWSAVDQYGNVEKSVAADQTKGCGDGRGKDYFVDIWRNKGVTKGGKRVPSFEATELRYPMTYDWERFTFRRGIIKSDAYFGEGVAIQETPQTRDRIFNDMSANNLVRWPEGYQPTGMPPGY